MTHYVANIGKARALLGYEPSVSLREGDPQSRNLVQNVVGRTSSLILTG
ncbi:MAG: hypothetical protein R3C44_07895 [Chloroflexota bacterium]